MIIKKIAGRTVEEHPLVVMVMILISDLLLPMQVSIPQSPVAYFLNLVDAVLTEDTTGLAVIAVLSDRVLHLVDKSTQNKV